MTGVAQRRRTGARTDKIERAWFCLLDVRYDSDSDKILQRSETTRRAINGSGQLYSITSSALASSDGGTVRPSALAVFRLMVKSNFVGCTTGSSAGVSPFRIRPT